MYLSTGEANPLTFSRSLPSFNMLPSKRKQVCAAFVVYMLLEKEEKTQNLTKLTKLISQIMHFPFNFCNCLAQRSLLLVISMLRPVLSPGLLLTLMITVKIRTILQRFVGQWMPLAPLVWLGYFTHFSLICHLLPFVKVGQKCRRVLEEIEHCSIHCEYSRAVNICLTQTLTAVST